ncbi:unnamed protein product [Rotaria sordida]|uniref:Uncharacterized protein n=1 Tax=Rotaria sordida TaxID=392033 RepID=A0A819XU49_9BILA|nr:unnamed protein product [Rotaria sordida]CAF4141751.1 unnamed protein product [Rotaria sordida]
MTDDRLFYSLTESSLLDTYLLYAIIGLLIFIAFIGLIVLLTTSCCCFYSISSCFCSYPCRRHSSYKLNERFQKQKNTKRNTFIKHHSSDITDFSHLYESHPHLINSKTMLTTRINNKNFDASCVTMDTVINPISPCSSFRSLNQSVSPVQIPLNNPSQPNIDKINLSTKGVDSRPFTYIKNPNDCTQILRRLPLDDRSISPSVISIDMTRISSLESDTNNQTNSPCTNIYETVIPIINNNSSFDQSTPIYETEWKHSLKQIMMSKIPSIEKNVISVIELPSLQSNLISSNHYFQQQYLYEKFLANRTKRSDSIRRANILKRLNDDAAFLY